MNTGPELGSSCILGRGLAGGMSFEACAHRDPVTRKHAHFTACGALMDADGDGAVRTHKVNHLCHVDHTNATVFAGSLQMQQLFFVLQLLYDGTLCSRPHPEW